MKFPNVRENWSQLPAGHRTYLVSAMILAPIFLAVIWLAPGDDKTRTLSRELARTREIEEGAIRCFQLAAFCEKQRQPSAAWVKEGLRLAEIARANHTRLTR